MSETTVKSAAAAPRSHVSSFHPFLQAYADRSERSLSYLVREWPELEVWRTRARAKMHELLAYDPLPAPRDARILESTRKDGYTRHRLRYSVTADRQTEAFLLIPDNLKTPAPAVMTLHDHSGFYFSGKEKVVATEDASGPLRALIEGAYSGRTIGDELARRGFVVLAPDAFYFGSQRLDAEGLPDLFTERLRGLEPGTDEYVRQFNRVAGDHEDLMARTIFVAGATWPGILFQGDRASLDYLLTRPEVDPGRIGCIGISLGGYRSTHLFGLDPRLKAGVVAGFMPTYASLLFDHLRWHTWMTRVPRQDRYLDLPDVVTLNVPRPLMVLNCLRDSLFTLEGMQAADAKIAAVYQKAGAPEAYRCRYDDEPHSLKIPAQEAAFAWLGQWLK